MRPGRQTRPRGSHGGRAHRARRPPAGRGRCAPQGELSSQGAAGPSSGRTVPSVRPRGGDARRMRVPHPAWAGGHVHLPCPDPPSQWSLKQHHRPVTGTAEEQVDGQAGGRADGRTRSPTRLLPPKEAGGARRLEDGRHELILAKTNGERRSHKHTPTRWKEEIKHTN